MGMFKNKPALSTFQAAVKDGRLIDMQTKPYAEFNRTLEVSCPLGMTPAAFNEFVAVPHEKGHMRVQNEARWAVVLATLHNVPRDGDPKELVYDVELFRLSGFNRFRSIKVVSMGPENNSGLIFMLPDEEFPLGHSE